MLRALREVMEQPGIVPMRIGVNTGKVFTGDFGPPYRRAYRVFGDAINTAARVMAKAEAGQILSTEIVLDRSRTLFETTPIQPFAAKGKSEPRPGIDRRAGHRHASEARPRRARVSSAATPSLRRSSRSSSRRAHGHGAVVEIAGEPGHRQDAAASTR